jgi:hypothetical protein
LNPLLHIDRFGIERCKIKPARFLKKRNRNAISTSPESIPAGDALEPTAKS